MYSILCDNCKNVIQPADELIWRIIKEYYEYNSISGRNEMRTDHYEFCSLKCLYKFVPTIKTDL